MAAIEAVIREIAERYDREEVRVEFIDADNWLSTPAWWTTSGSSK